MTAQRLLDRLDKVTGRFPRWRARRPSCGGRNGVITTAMAAMEVA